MPIQIEQSTMIKSLEGGRGVAALIVALYHLKVGAAYFGFIRHGYIFVDLFLVLSGFIIYAAYSSRMSSAQDFQSFLIRRIGRLFPLLVFSTVFFILVANMIVLAKNIAYAYGYGGFLNNPEAREYLIPSAAEIISTLTFTHGMGVFEELILNTPSWSISTEFYTYLLFAAACLFLLGAARLVTFAVLGITGFLISIWASTQIHDCLQQGGCLSLTYDFGFPRTVFSFFLGALAYHASRVAQFDFKVLQLPGLLGLAVLFTLVDALPVVAFAFPFMFALLILSVRSDEGFLSNIFNLKPFQVLGQRSYSIYLMHMPLLLVFENITKRVDGLIPSTIVVVAYVAVLIVVSGWTYKYIEDRFRARFNRFASRHANLEKSEAFLKIKEKSNWLN
jgi:peptidoglycan/LPS O-acetylase OafA/YrhL